MEITTTVDGTRATVSVKGFDTRAAPDFEVAFAKAIDASARRVIVEFSAVDLITSAGIRVLVMVAKRLRSGGSSCCVASDPRFSACSISRG